MQLGLSINPKLLGKAHMGRVATYHPVLDNTRFEELYGYNLPKARGLLEQAGYPNGFEFTSSWSIPVGILISRVKSSSL